MKYKKYRRPSKPNFEIYDGETSHQPIYGKRMFPEIGKMTWNLWVRTLSLLEIKELMKEMALYIQAAEIQEERNALHKKFIKNGNKHNAEDEKRASYLFNLLMELPNGDDREDREAKELIREAGKFLKKRKSEIK